MKMARFSGSANSAFNWSNSKLAD